MYLRSTKPRPLCPVCGKVSYSRGGIHPQCALHHADAKRMEGVKAARKAASPEPKAANPLALSPWHKRCPKCKAQLHIRKLTCKCGYCFSKVG